MDNIYCDFSRKYDGFCSSVATFFFFLKNWSPILFQQKIKNENKVVLINSLHKAESLQYKSRLTLVHDNMWQNLLLPEIGTCCGCPPSPNCQAKKGTGPLFRLSMAKKKILDNFPPNILRVSLLSITSWKCFKILNRPRDPPRTLLRVAQRLRWTSGNMVRISRKIAVTSPENLLQAPVETRREDSSNTLRGHPKHIVRILWSTLRGPPETLCKHPQNTLRVHTKHFAGILRIPYKYTAETLQIRCGHPQNMLWVPS